MKRRWSCWSMTRPAKKISHDNLPSARWRQEGLKTLPWHSFRAREKQLIHIHKNIFGLPRCEKLVLLLVPTSFLFFLSFLFFHRKKSSYFLYIYFFPHDDSHTAQCFRIFFKVRKKIRNKEDCRTSHCVPGGIFFKIPNLFKSFNFSMKKTFFVSKPLNKINF
jgi:hypothetical protein